MFNYDAVNNEIATKILDELVKQDGTCTMFDTFRKDFHCDAKNLKLWE